MIVSLPNETLYIIYASGGGIILFCILCCCLRSIYQRRKARLQKESTTQVLPLNPYDTTNIKMITQNDKLSELARLPINEQFAIETSGHSDKELNSQRGEKVGRSRVNK